MKTISEMATDYMNDNRLAIYDYYTGEVEQFASLDIRLAYKRGANAVIEEIEKAIDSCPENSVKITIENKIKELKGK